MYDEYPLESPPDELINIFELPNGTGKKYWTYKVSPHKDKCDCPCHDGQTVWDGKHCKCGFSMGSMRLTEDLKGVKEMGHHDPSLSYPTEYMRKG